MLNSRYIHLHQALGLGIMWLNQHAQIRPAQGSLKTENATQAQPNLAHLNAANTSNARFNATPNRTSNTAIQGNALAKIRQRSPYHPSSAPTATPQPTIAPQPTPSIHTPALLPAKLLILSVCPSVDDMAAGKLFSGADGEMLHKMLHAIALPPEQAHFSTWLKNSPDFNPRPDAQTITAAAPSIAQEWQQTQAQAMLLLGDFFHRPEVQTALNAIAPASARYHIPHPMRLASNPQLKRSAWETLQQLQAALK